MYHAVTGRARCAWVIESDRVAERFAEWAQEEIGGTFDVVDCKSPLGELLAWHECEREFDDEEYLTPAVRVETVCLPGGDPPVATGPKPKRRSDGG